MITTGEPAKPKKTVRFPSTLEQVHEVKPNAMDDTMAIDAELEGDDDEIDEDEIERSQLKTWRSNLITDNQDTVYMEHFKGSPLMIEISIFK